MPIHLFADDPGFNCPHCGSLIDDRNPIVYPDPKSRTRRLPSCPQCREMISMIVHGTDRKADDGELGSLECTP